jgi:EAL domain-containing protein (putative c-di-GMP-specific phosphodiesterase class I)
MLDKPYSLDQDFIHNVLASLRNTLNLEVAFVSEITGGRRIFRFVDSDENFTPIAVNQSDPVDESYCQRVIDGRLPELIPDATQIPEALTIAATKLLPVGAHLSVPIELTDGELYGTLCAFSRKTNTRLNQADIKLMRIFSKLVGGVIEKELIRSRNLEVIYSRLQKVIDSTLFEVHYQPIFNVALGKVVGYEALTRFNAEPKRSPDKWFNEAIEVGLDAELELATMKLALRGLDHFSADIYVSINVSPSTILLGVLGEALQGHDLSRIVLEVTEHASVSDYEEVAYQLHPFREQGLRLAVDDAGAGYASFKHILKLKPDVIKLDKSLIDQIDTDQGCYALAAALVRFGEEMSSKIVAEGVETESQLKALRELKVNKVQGHLLGRPEPLPKA